MTATCSFARGPVNSAFHEAVRISFLMSDIRSLSTYLTCPAWAGWVQLDDEFVYLPASTCSYPAGPDIPPDINNYPPRTPLTPLLVWLLKLARLVRPNSPDNSFTGTGLQPGGLDIKSGELEVVVLAMIYYATATTDTTLQNTNTTTTSPEAGLQSVTPSGSYEKSLQSNEILLKGSLDLVTRLNRVD